MPTPAETFADKLYRTATPILRIHGMGDPHWRRTAAKGSKDVWQSATYENLDLQKWRASTYGVYMVGSEDGTVLYVGTCDQGLATAFRLSPAFDAETRERMAKAQLFHHECWPHLQQSYAEGAEGAYEVRLISADDLAHIVKTYGIPRGALPEGTRNVRDIRTHTVKWLLRNRTPALAWWNSEPRPDPKPRRKHG